MHLGYIVDSVDNEYQKKIIEGAISATRDYDHKLFIFESGTYYQEAKNKKKNFVYHLGRTKTLDGLIIQSASLSNYMNSQNLKEFCDSFPQPKICIGQKVPGYITISSLNLDGFDTLLKHLLVEHEYKKFLVISGPENNNDVKTRMEHLISVMATFQIELPPENIINGSLVHSVAYAKMKEFLKTHKMDFDAIISFNDDMAFAIIRALKEHSIKIPEEVALIGYDNIQESAYINPSLSTIDQSLYKQGYLALESLVKLMQGDHIPDDIDVPTEVRIRESCGCELSKKPLANLEKANIEYVKLKERNRILDALRRQTINIRLNKKKFKDEFINKVPYMDLNFVSMILYRNKEKNFSPNTAQVYLTYINHVINKDDKIIFSTEILIPEEILSNECRTYIIEPIYYEDKIFGYIIFDYQSALLDLYRTLKNILSNIFFEGMMFKRIKKQKTTLINQKTQLKENLNYMQSAMSAFIETLVKTIEIKDPYTAGHQRKVSELAKKIAIELGLSEFEVEGIRMAGIIHDLGKIYVPTEILNKPGKLRDMEFKMIKTHPVVAYDILKSIHFPWPIADIVLQHHEHLDGTGYPNKITKEDILLSARIIAVADVVEAMASHRPYRPSLGIDKALTEIFSKKDIFFDSEIVDICISLFTQKDYKFPI